MVDTSEFCDLPFGLISSNVQQLNLLTLECWRKLKCRSLEGLQKFFYLIKWNLFFLKIVAVAFIPLKHPLLACPPIKPGSAPIMAKDRVAKSKVYWTSLLINWEQKLCFLETLCNIWSPLENAPMQSATARDLRSVKRQVLDRLLKIFWHIQHKVYSLQKKFEVPGLLPNTRYPYLPFVSANPRI